MLNYVYARWPSAIDNFTYILHDGKQHGIEVDKLPDDTTLILVPDASSNEYEIHQQLKEKGIDIVILDHHYADKVSEYACVVNNQLDSYPTKSLCGCAIVYKFCQAIDELYNDIGFVDQFIDIVGTALIGDMMDIRDFETRYLINQGLKNFRNPFIAGMAEKNAYSMGSQVTPHGVAFYIVPLVNAITRMGTIEEKAILFESMLNYKAYNLVPSTKRGHKPGDQETILAQCLRVCTNVKNRQTREQDAAVELIEKKIQQNNLLQHQIILVQLDAASFDSGITGLIANKIMAKYQKPTLLTIKRDKDGQILWSGSGRSPGRCELGDFRQFCADSGLVELAQGHGLAFGFSILDANVEQFLAYCDEKLKDITFSPSYKVDYIWRPQTIDAQTILTLGDMKIFWGQNLEEPLLAIEHLSVTKDMLTLMSKDKNPTLKIQLPNGVSCIKFKSNENEFESLYSDTGCVTINLVAKAEVNKWNGSVTPQLIIEDYEIINKQQYYF